MEIIFIGVKEMTETTVGTRTIISLSKIKEIIGKCNRPEICSGPQHEISGKDKRIRVLIPRHTVFLSEKTAVPGNADSRIRLRPDTHPDKSSSE